MAALGAHGGFTGISPAASRSLSIGLKKSKISQGSLRLLGKSSWQEGLSKASFVLDDAVESTPAEAAVMQASKKAGRQRVASRGTTVYLLNGATLCVSDSAVRLQWTSAAALDDVLGCLMMVMLPSWKAMCPDEYLKHAVFSQTSLPEEQQHGEPCWQSDVEKLQEHFFGDTVVLGSERGVMQRLFVANYGKRDEISDFICTQVIGSDLEATDGFSLAEGAKSLPPGPLRSHWGSLHGKEPRCPSVKAQLVECYTGSYIGAAAFGPHTTSCVSTVAGSATRKVVLSASMPMPKDARERFVSGAQHLGHPKQLSVAEFSLSPVLFNAGDAPCLDGFKLVQTSRHVGADFACALHHFVRDSGSMKVACAPLQVHCMDKTKPASRKSAVMVDVLDEASSASAGAELYLEENASSDLPVALLDVGALKRQADLWATELPRVAPCYAVKCNSNSEIVSALWSHWNERSESGLVGEHGGFDCASPAEMDVVRHLPGLNMGKHVIYANPCKHGSAVEYAKQVGVRRIVFDNLQELDKLQRLYPEAELVLRVQTDDSVAQCPLSNKFGAPVADCGALLDRALELQLEVVGVSFHVGSGCSEVGAFRSALHRARAVFDEAEKRGLSLSLLDIGGGFPGCDEPGEASFSDHAADIREMLDEHFPDSALRVIAEPGRFFAAKSQAVLATVLSVADSAQGFRYYLNDGVYGSFNCLIYDHAHVSLPEIFRAGRKVDMDTLGSASRCTIFGPTCDGFDMISDKLELPELQCGDKLLFGNMGAYTSSASTSFNGFAPATCFIFESALR